MAPLFKFWIASTLALFLLVLWPLRQTPADSSSAGESGLEKEAKLVDHFCLAKAPTGGAVSVPKSWEEALEANIRVRDVAGEAASDIGLPRERSGEVASLRPGQGIYHADEKGEHYVLKSAQGSNWFVVLSKKPRGTIKFPGEGGRGPSPLAMAVALAVVGGGIMTLLAKVAFGSKRPAE